MGDDSLVSDDLVYIVDNEQYDNLANEFEEFSQDLVERIQNLKTKADGNNNYNYLIHHLKETNELTNLNSPQNKSDVRVWCDGCYDMVHFGHANSLRQAKELGTHLSVGLHSDEEITLHKGPPVFTEEERYTMVRGIKWVDEVYRGVPYVTTCETLDQYNCDFCSHGNDITTTADGKDTYQEVKDAGRYKEVQRTQGVSTTDIVGRMLRLPHDGNKSDEPISKNDAGDIKISSPWTGGQQFLATTKKILQFANSATIPDGAEVVYVAGTFDLLHPGHLHFLEKASQLGKYLMVGIYDDPTVELLEGPQHPIMNLQERVMGILACKYVSDIVFGAPYIVSEELLEHFNVSHVVHGKTPVQPCPRTNQDPYTLAKSRGLYVEIDSGSSLTTQMVIQRILSNRQQYEERNRKKEKKEAELIEAARLASINQIHIST